MKRFVAAMVILAIAVGGSIWMNVYVKNRVEELVELAETLAETAKTKDMDDAQSALDELENLWEKSTTPLHMFVIHRELTEIELNLHMLGSYLDGENWALFREGTVRIKESLEHILHTQEMSLRNVF
ncbi:MAG: DUF4363 family protein [Oscillospiraceae bacterium]|nr:DUF4363 family protein [Oscillospiraceae bacterium]